MKTKTLLIAVSVALVLSTCSAMNGIGQMMVDAGELMMDAGNGNAQTNTPQKVVTAETDMARQEGNVVRLAAQTTVEVVTGPVVVNNLLTNNDSSSSVSAYAWVIPAAMPCPAGQPADAFDIGGFHIQRLVLKDGQKLCALAAFGNTTLVWAGFRPY